MKTSLSFIKKTTALMASAFLLISGQALAYPSPAQGVVPAPALTLGPALNPTSANLVSKRDKLGSFYDQPSFTFNDAVGIQSTGSTNTIQVSKNSVVGASCQKGQLATDGIGKLLSCESGRFAEANGGGAQDTATERAIFNNAKGYEGLVLFTPSSRLSRTTLYSRPVRIGIDMKIELLILAPQGYRGAAGYNFSLGGILRTVNLKRGDLLAIQMGDWNASYADIRVYVNGRMIIRQYRGYLGRFTGVKFGKLLDAPNLSYNPYRVALGLTPR